MLYPLLAMVLAGIATQLIQPEEAMMFPVFVGIAIAIYGVIWLWQFLFPGKKKKKGKGRWVSCRSCGYDMPSTAVVCKNCAQSYLRKHTRDDDSDDDDSLFD